jgi:predicted ester cyclase
LNTVQWILESLVAVVHWACEGTHEGNGLGFPATGRKVSFRGMTWIRFSGDKMVEGWDCWNQGGLIESLRAPQEIVADPTSLRNE